MLHPPGCLRSGYWVEFRANNRYQYRQTGRRETVIRVYGIRCPRRRGCGVVFLLPVCLHSSELLIKLSSTLCCHFPVQSAPTHLRPESTIFLQLPSVYRVATARPRESPVWLHGPSFWCRCWCSLSSLFASPYKFGSRQPPSKSFRNSSTATPASWFRSLVFHLFRFLFEPSQPLTVLSPSV